MAETKRMVIQRIILTAVIAAFGFAFGINGLAASYPSDYQHMLERAERIVNYTWTPQVDMAVWNENPYNGSNTFQTGTEVKGMPYTLFWNEVVEYSLLSLVQYEAVVSDNYSATAHCISTGSERTGPVYGSCCATFVSEVFGGFCMNGDKPVYHGVGQIVNSPYTVTTRNVQVSDIESGDALSNSSGSHIIWVGDISGDQMTIYEQTPPVAQKRTFSIAKYTNDAGYLVLEYPFGDPLVFSVATKYLDSAQTDYTVDPAYPAPFYANTISVGKTPVYNAVNGNQKANYIYGKGVEPAYTDDQCLVKAVYTNGWCCVEFPLTSGRTETGYVPLSAFLENPSYTCKDDRLTEVKAAYARSDLTDQTAEVPAGEEVVVVGETSAACQVIGLLPDGYRHLMWLRKASDKPETEETGNQTNTETAESESQEPESQETGSQETESQGTESQETEDQETEGQETEGGQGETYADGDANGDSVVDGRDLIRLRKHLAARDGGETVSQITVCSGADVNGDGAIDGRDLIRLRKKLVE